MRFLFTVKTNLCSGSADPKFDSKSNRYDKVHHLQLQDLYNPQETRRKVGLWGSFAKNDAPIGVRSSTRAFRHQQSALSRFIARLGCPQNVYTDNGTNFVEASRAIKRELKSFLANAQQHSFKILLPIDVLAFFNTCRTRHDWSMGMRRWQF